MPLDTQEGIWEPIRTQSSFLSALMWWRRAKKRRNQMLCRLAYGSKRSYIWELHCRTTFCRGKSSQCWFLSSWGSWTSSTWVGNICQHQSEEGWRQIRRLQEILPNFDLWLRCPSDFHLVGFRWLIETLICRNPWPTLKLVLELLHNLAARTLSLRKQAISQRTSCMRQFEWRSWGSTSISETLR